MVDNVAVTPGSGATIATDDVGGVQYQRVKVDLGGDGAGSPLVRGQQAKANSLPVALASDQDALPVTDNAGSLTVDDGGASLTVDGTVALGAGAASIGTLGANSGVDIGDVTINNAAGAAAVNIQDGGNSITVDGSVSLGAALPAGTNNIGDVDLASAIPAGDNLVGRVKLSDGTTVADVVDLTTRNALAVAIVDGNGDQLTSFGGGGAGTEVTEDAAAAANPVGGMTMARRRDSLAGETSADGDNVALNATDKGELYVKHADSLAVTGTVTASNTAGAAAHDAAVAGNPVLAGGYASAAAPADVSGDGDAVRAWRLRNGAAATVVTAAGALIGGDATNGLDVDVTRLPALPAGNNNIGDVDVASLPALPAGSNNIGDVDVLTVNGQSAHDAAVAGNPLRTGGRAESTELTAVADGDTCDFITDLTGKQVVMPYAVPERLVAGVTAAITNTSNTQVLAAAGAGLRNYVTSILVTNSHASTGTLVEIKDGTTVIWRGYAAPNGGGFAVQFPTPLRGTANTAVNAANVTTSSNTYVSAAGYVAP